LSKVHVGIVGIPEENDFVILLSRETRGLLSRYTVGEGIGKKKILEWASAEEDLHKYKKLTGGAGTD
jgi:hypothetical protein